MAEFEIKVMHGIQGASHAVGLAVAIDVLRATSWQYYAIAAGAERIIAVASLEEAYALKSAYPHFVLAGERGLRKQQGFDYGNSPFEIQGVNFVGKTIIHTTSHGTQGLAKMEGASQVICASFVNAQAAAVYIRSSDLKQVSLVCMGNDGGKPAEEDTALAEYLAALLTGRTPLFAPIYESLRNSVNGTRFLNGAYDFAPPQDFELCLSLNRFDFVVGGNPQDEGRIVLTRVVK